MTFQWPKGSPAAISFTYDDGYPAGAAVAAPHLEEFGIRGTFYVTWIFIERNLPAWKRVHDAGHELGNHTMTHPHEHLEEWFETPEDFMKKETGPMEQAMNDHFGIDQYRTYRYIGWVHKLGTVGTDEEKIAAYEYVMEKTFVAASPGPDDTQDPLQVRNRRFKIGGRVPTWGSGNNSQRAIDFMKQTLDRGHWGVLIFHEIVDGDANEERQTSKAVHEEIIKYALENNFWIAPFRDVYDYVVRNTP